MLSTKDLDYIDTKLVKRGEKTLNKAFNDLIDWIECKYGIRPINIFYDINMPFNNPRINIVLETHEEELTFRSENRVNFDSIKQKEIETKAKELVEFHDLTKKFRTKDLFIYFSNFASIAKSEAGENIPSELWSSFLEKYKKGDIWEIHNSGPGLIIFFYKSKLIERLKEDKIIQELEQEYLQIIRPYDEFNYIDKVRLNFDSKENFEKKYEGNWMYYYR